MLRLSEINLNGFNRFMQAVASSGVGVAILAPTAHHLDRVVLALTGGRHTFIGLASGLPIVTFTMKGAKSGLERSLPLIAVPDGDCIILIATNFGQPHTPGWYFNMRANPQVTATYRGHSAKYVVEELTGAEKERAFALGNAAYMGYSVYLKRAAHRVIHVLCLRELKQP
jgi:deazaflavin-dependent oxidoreductase (nitroreductase family)